MLVSNIEEMERIVSSREDLEWDGWNVIKYTRSHNAMFSTYGILKNGVWCTKKIFPVTENGWVLPNTMRESYEKLEK
jgi:hypothetical protein